MWRYSRQWLKRKAADMDVMEVKAVMSSYEQRWMMRTVKGGGWSAWMR